MSDSLNLPQPFMQALSAALIQKLDPVTVSSTLQKFVPHASEVPPKKEALNSVVNEIYALLLRNNVATQALPGTRHASPRTPLPGTPRIATRHASPRTPGSSAIDLTPEYVRISDVRTPMSGVVNLAGAPLSRTSSNCSSVSTLSRTSSNCSNVSGSDRSFNDDEEEDEDKVFMKKRKSTPAQDLADAKIVTAPILSHFDANWLARDPKDEDNPMFEFRVRSGIGFGSQPPRKKYADLVVPFFRKNSRAIIRRLVTANLRDEQQQNPSITYEDLRRRYEASALKVVRKRRANHVQSWRPDRRGTHCPLIYGGVSPVSSNDKPRVDAENDKPRVDAENDKPRVDAEPKQRAGKTNQVSWRPDEPGPPNGCMRAKPRVIAKPKQRAAIKNTAGVSFLNRPDENILKCKECKEKLTPVCAYPKERWGSACGDVWCSECWQKEQNRMVCQHISDVKKRKAKLKELQKKNDGEDGATPPPRKRQKRKNNKKMIEHS